MENLMDFKQFNESNKPGLELDEIKTKVISYMKDACCGASPLDIATALGNVKVADVKNVLTQAQKDGIVVKKDAKKDTFEFIQKV